jgi:PAS domain-containing protein
VGPGPESALTDPQIQQTLMGEACFSAEVGFVVWDDDRRYLAANAAACDLLGASLEQIIGSVVGARTVGGEDAIAAVLRGEGARGRATVDKFDGTGTVAIGYVSFPTRAAGLPYMASVIWPA